jgi:hypothetical protein
MPRSFCFSAESIEEMAEKIKEDSGFRPTLGIVFSSVALGIPDLSDEIATLGIPVFGCSTCGEILSKEDTSPMLEQSIVCCLFDIDPAIFSVDLLEKGERTSFSFGESIGKWGMNIFSSPAFIITVSGLKNDGEAIVRGIEAVCPPGTPIFGGLAGDDSLFEETFVFTHQRYSRDGAAVLVFDRSRVGVNGVVSSGWVGVGTEGVVTSSDGNIVYSIDNKPAEPEIVVVAHSLAPWRCRKLGRSMPWPGFGRPGLVGQTVVLCRGSVKPSGAPGGGPVTP